MVQFSARSMFWRAMCCGLALIPLIFPLVSGTPAAVAQAPTTSMVQEYMKSWYAAWESKDADLIARVDQPANGFGFRTLKPRSADVPPADHMKTIKSFLALMEYFHIKLTELHTAVDGDIGMAWGFHTEEFKMKGQAPEKVRVRFTMTLKFERNRWRTLIAHRDIQRFDERGYRARTQ